MGLLALTGLLRPVGDTFYDLAVRLSSPLGGASTQVLLVEIEAARYPPAPEELAVLFRDLDLLGARRVVVTFLPPNAPRELLTAQVGDEPVVFGRLLRIDPAAADRGLGAPYTPSTLPPDVPPEAVAWGVLSQPTRGDGIARAQRTTYAAGNDHLPSLEARVAAAAGHELEPRQTFWVDFRAGVESLPAVSLAQVLGGGLVREVVEGRTVLVGAALAAPSEGVRTPLDPSGTATSEARYHAHALDTLLSGRRLRALPWPWAVFLVLLVAAASAFAFEQGRLPFAQTVTIGLAVVILLAFPLGLRFLALRLPTMEMLTVLFFVSLLSLRRKTVTGHEQLGRLEAEAALKVQKYASSGESLSSAGDFWKQLLVMVNQVFEYRRLIFFERIDGERRMREVEMIRCSSKDIREKRRDFTRSPYREACETGAPVVSDRFFHDHPDDEATYLVPLIVGTQVQGFWVLEATRESETGSSKKFEAILRQFAQAIAELVFQRKYVSAEGLLPAKKRGGGDPGAVLVRRVRGAMVVLEKRLDGVETLLRSLGQALIVYNLVGKVLEMSTAMAELLEQARIPPYDATALELVVALTKKDEHEARRWLQEVIVRRQMVSLPLQSFEARPGALFMLRLRPLLFDKPSEETNVGPTPFEVHGIIIELEDISRWKSANEAMNALERELRNSLEAFALSTRMLSRKKLPDVQRLELAKMLEDKVGEAEGLISRTQEILSAGFLEIAALPVDAQIILHELVEKLEPRLAERGLELVLDEPGVRRQVLASPVQLREVFEAILDLLIEDAIDGGTIAVKVNPVLPELIYFELSNEGYGFPMEELTFGETASTQDLELRDLQNALDWVDKWQGTWKITSEVGQGIAVHLELKNFL